MAVGALSALGDFCNGAQFEHLFAKPIV